MSRMKYIAAACAAMILAGCGKGGDEAKFEALCKKAGMSGEVLEHIMDDYAKADKKERAELTKNLQNLIANPIPDEDEE